MDLLGHYLQDRQQKIRKTTDGIRSEIYEQLDCGEEISDERLGQIIDEKIRQKQDIQLALEERESIHREIFAAIRGLDVLQELLEDDSITEIMVNGTQDIFLERCGRLERCSKHFENKARLSDVAQRIGGSVKQTGKRICSDTGHPSGGRFKSEYCTAAGCAKRAGHYNS